MLLLGLIAVCLIVLLRSDITRHYQDSSISLAVVFVFAALGQQDKGMRLVKDGGFAFHLDTIIAYPAMRRTFTESEICESQEVYMIPMQKMGPLIQKHSQYREHFAYGKMKCEDSVLVHVPNIYLQH
ncbi:unnamed protein product [Leptidea sinapis]|uniref:Uncharacterized protein n=1 Tax=Leptidea sinapis TaxID=189913 RepID=A0A5E4QZH9_9NEOP|nr:unnamed protein product [Leptidea sinapis]